MNCEKNVCIKCGNIGKFDIHYHIGNERYQMENIGNPRILDPRCTLDQCNQHNKEHLHVTCNICRYDWIKPTEDSDNRKRK